MKTQEQQEQKYGFRIHSTMEVTRDKDTEDLKKAKVVTHLSYEIVVPGKKTIIRGFYPKKDDGTKNSINTLKSLFVKSEGAYVDDAKRLELAREWDAMYPDNPASYTKEVPCTDEEVLKVYNFVEEKLKNPGTYDLQSSNCVHEVNDAYQIIRQGIFTDIYTSEELDKQPGLTMSGVGRLWMEGPFPPGDRPYKVLSDLSLEDFAAKWNIPVKRLSVTENTGPVGKPNGLVLSTPPKNIITIAPPPEASVVELEEAAGRIQRAFRNSPKNTQILAAQDEAYKLYKLMKNQQLKSFESLYPDIEGGIFEGIFEEVEETSNEVVAEWVSDPCKFIQELERKHNLVEELRTSMVAKLQEKFSSIMEEFDYKVNNIKRQFNQKGLEKSKSLKQEAEEIKRIKTQELESKIVKMKGDTKLYVRIEDIIESGASKESFIDREIGVLLRGVESSLETELDQKLIHLTASAHVMTEEERVSKVKSIVVTALKAFTGQFRAIRDKFIKKLEDDVEKSNKEISDLKENGLAEYTAGEKAIHQQKEQEIQAKTQQLKAFAKSEIDTIKQRKQGECDAFFQQKKSEFEAEWAGEKMCAQISVDSSTIGLPVIIDSGPIAQRKNAEVDVFNAKKDQELEIEKQAVLEQVNNELESFANSKEAEAEQRCEELKSSINQRLKSRKESQVKFAENGVKKGEAQISNYKRKIKDIQDDNVLIEKIKELVGNSRDSEAEALINEELNVFLQGAASDFGVDAETL